VRTAHHHIAANHETSSFVSSFFLTYSYQELIPKLVRDAHPTSYNNLGLAYSALGDSKKAIDYY
jgi:hypothetical protein